MDLARPHSSSSCDGRTNDGRADRSTIAGCRIFCRYGSKLNFFDTGSRRWCTPRLRRRALASVARAPGARSADGVAGGVWARQHDSGAAAAPQERPVQTVRKARHWCGVRHRQVWRGACRKRGRWAKATSVPRRPTPERAHAARLIRTLQNVFIVPASEPRRVALVSSRGAAARGQQDAAAASGCARPLRVRRRPVVSAALFSDSFRQFTSRKRLRAARVL